MAKNAITKRKQTRVAARDKNEVDEETNDFLRATQFVDAINKASKHTKLEPLPPSYKIKSRDQKVVGLAMHTAFELCGGVPALILWAKENPDKFYTLWSKLDQHGGSSSQAAGGQTFNFISAIPDSPLDRKTLRANGEVVELTTDGKTVDVEFDEDDE